MLIKFNRIAVALAITDTCRSSIHSTINHLNRQLQGFLFDLDGTLVESENIHYESYKLTLLEYSPHFNNGKPISKEYYDRIAFGGTDKIIVPKIFPQFSTTEIQRFIEKKDEIFIGLSASVKKIPGVDNFLDWADDVGMRSLVVTNCNRVDAECILKEVNLERLIDNIVIADECEYHKPHPAPYLKALKLLNLNPHQALAFEDSNTGIQSALSAGLDTIGVSSSLTSEDLQKLGVVHVVSDYNDEKLKALIESRLSS